jgi:hypothetical protein
MDLWPQNADNNEDDDDTRSNVNIGLWPDDVRLIARYLLGECSCCRCLRPSPLLDCDRHASPRGSENKKVVPGGLQRVVLEHFRRQPAKWSQEASRGSFWSISGGSPQSGPRNPPEGRVEHFRRQLAKWSQEASRGSFWSISIRIANPCSVVHFIDAHAYILKAFRLQLPHLKMHTFCILAISWKHTSYSYPK